MTCAYVSGISHHNLNSISINNNFMRVGSLVLSPGGLRWIKIKNCGNTLLTPNIQECIYPNHHGLAKRNYLGLQR